ncbi:Uncharacterised protein [uncultured archaeon]|nr:Uncharacterised protein [uncultured archaeon]
MEKCPINVGDAISVFTHGDTTKYLKVEYVEPLPPSRDLIKDFSSLASGATSNDNEITILEMNGTKSSDAYHELFVGWMEILDLIEITVKQPSSVSRFQTKASNIALGPWSGEVPITIYQDETLYLDVTALQTLTKTRVAFYGYRVVCSSLSNENEAKNLAVQKGKQIYPMAAAGFSS